MPAVIPIVAAVGSALISNAGAKKAANAQAAAADRASEASLLAQEKAQAFQQQQADLARQDNAPWLKEGANALAQLGRRTSEGGDLVRAFGASDFEADPGYQFRMAEGQKAITNSLAARGGAMSGAAVKQAMRFGQGLASDEYGNAFNRFQATQVNAGNRLAALANVGQIAAGHNGGNAMTLGGQVGNGMMNTATNVGNNLIGAGNARASGYLAQSNAWGNALNSLGSQWNQYSRGT